MKKVLKVVFIILAIMLLLCLASIWISYNWLTVSSFNVTSDKDLSSLSDNPDFGSARSLFLQ